MEFSSWESCDLMFSSADSVGLSQVLGRPVLVAGPWAQLACPVKAVSALIFNVVCHLKMVCCYLSNLSIYFLLGKENH